MLNVPPPLDEVLPIPWIGFRIEGSNLMKSCFLVHMVADEPLSISIWTESESKETKQGLFFIDLIAEVKAASTWHWEARRRFRKRSVLCASRFGLELVFSCFVRVNVCTNQPKNGFSLIAIALFVPCTRTNFTWVQMVEDLASVKVGALELQLRVRFLL